MSEFSAADKSNPSHKPVYAEEESCKDVRSSPKAR